MTACYLDDFRVLSFLRFKVQRTKIGSVKFGPIKCRKVKYADKKPTSGISVLENNMSVSALITLHWPAPGICKTTKL